MPTNLLHPKAIECCLKVAAIRGKVYGNRAIVVSLFLSVVLGAVVVMRCALVLEVLKFFFPLLISTGVSVTAVYEFILSGGNHHAEGLAQITDATNVETGGEAGDKFSFFVDDASVKVSFVPLEDSRPDRYMSLKVKVLVIQSDEKKGLERLVQNNISIGCEDTSSTQVHNFAEGMWNWYIGNDFLEMK